ncbi:uncharacterized protein ACJ7VT_009146 [Polymixia lowei]
MDQFEERLAEEVRRYKHLYDPSSKYYKHGEVTLDAWKEIGEKLAEDPGTCMKRWKAVRDRFVRLKKKMKTEPGGQKVPAYYLSLSWLHGFVKHRSAESSSANTLESDDNTTLSTSDDEGTSASGPSSVTTPSSSQPAKKRKRGTDILETIGELRREQVANCTALVSQINASTQNCQDRDEYLTFGLAVADSLRKLPKDRVETTKARLFTVLGEAHMQ